MSADESNTNSQSRADEQTPLLSRAQQQTESTWNSAFDSICENLGLKRRKSTSSSLGVDPDHDEDRFEDLRRQRSRLSSYPTIEVPNELKRDGNGPSGDDAVNNEESAAGQGLSDSAAAVEPGTVNQGAPDSKYVGVSTARFWLIFSTVLLGYVVACFDTTLMASTHPVITSYFGASESASWLTTAFMITNTGFQPLWGRLSDTIGRKWVYLLVLTIFGLTNMWCALSQDIGSFIAARAICGLGAGGTMSMGLVIVNDLVKIEYRGIYVSHINFAFGLGSACGAAFGGVLCDRMGWRWTFGFQVPVVVVCALGALAFTPRHLGPMLIKKRSPDTKENPALTALKNFDHAGVAVLVTSVTFLILFLNLGGNIYPWDHPVVIVCAVLAVIGSGFLIWIEKRAKQPVMPLHLLYKAPQANLVYANFLAGIASNTVLFNVPLWFQAVKLETPTESGLRLAAPSIGGALAGILTGYIITWTRRLKPTLVIGALVYLAGSITLCFIRREYNTAISIVMITPAPLAQGFIYPNTMMSAFSIAETHEQAVVTTTLSLWRNLGIVVGVAVSSLVFQNELNKSLDKFVQGPDRIKVIKTVRDSVRAVIDLPPRYRGQAIHAYAVALKLSFITAVVASVIMVIICVPIRLPRLSKKAAAPAGE